MRQAALETRQQSASSQLPASLEAFFALADKFELTTEEQIKLLGSPGRSTFFKWKKEGGSISLDTEERISHLLNIWKCLVILFPSEQRAVDWLRRNNTFFHGQSALEFMLGGKVADILLVRSYLDAQRGG